MIQKRLNKFIFDHPILLQISKKILSTRVVANSSFYKYLVMKKVRRFASENREYKNSIFIENTLDCNSRCVFCAHSKKIMTGTMSKNLFEKIIDECHEFRINNIILGVYGEPLMDKLFFERINYIRKYEMTFGLITNASLLSPEKVDELFKIGGFSLIHFSVNGFSNDVYEKTMVGLKRDITYRNILYFLEQKNKLGMNDLVVNISVVLTSLNKKDFKEFFKFWNKQKGVNTVLPTELIDRMGDAYSGEIGELGPMTNKYNWLSPCRSLWSALMIYHDGKVSPCCKDNDKRKLIVGDINIQTVGEISTGKALDNLRQCHLSGKRRSHPICVSCFLNSVWIGK